MTDNNVIQIKVVGAEAIASGLAQFSQIAISNMSQAAQEAGTEVIKTRGLFTYPPMTNANRMPYPFYERGLGTWTSAMYNTRSSEDYHAQWSIVRSGTGAIIGNSASYSMFLGGERQAIWAGVYGWRKLKEVAEEKTAEIAAIFQKWIDRARQQAGLR